LFTQNALERGFFPLHQKAKQAITEEIKSKHHTKMLTSSKFHKSVHFGDCDAPKEICFKDIEDLIQATKTKFVVLLMRRMKQEEIPTWWAAASAIETDTSKFVSVNCDEEGASKKLCYSLFPAFVFNQTQQINQAHVSILYRGSPSVTATNVTGIKVLGAANFDSTLVNAGAKLAEVRAIIQKAWSVFYQYPNLMKSDKHLNLWLAMNSFQWDIEKARDSKFGMVHQQPRKFKA